MSAAEFPLQQAIYTKLTGTAAVTALVGSRIFDGKPDQAPAFPYIIIGEMTGTDFDTKSTDGEETVLNIDTFSKYNGNKEARQIMGTIHGALHKANLSPTGHDLIFLYWVASRGPFTDPDPEIRHGIQSFRAVTQAQ